MQYINTLFSKQRDFYKSHQTLNIKGRLVLLKKLKAEIIANESAILDALQNDLKIYHFGETIELSGNKFSCAIYCSCYLFFLNYNITQNPENCHIWRNSGF